ncbi:MAG: hypothetical protein RLP15_07575, partial [Cryomorphaceae bacterium]
APLQMDALCLNNVLPNWPPFWTGANLYASANPFILGGTYGGDTYNFDISTCQNFLPTPAFCNGNYVVSWNYHTTGSAQYACELTTTNNNNYIAQHNYIGNDFYNLISRQLSNEGIIQNPGISVVNDQNSSEQNHMVISNSGKYDPNNEVLYTWYDENDGSIVYKSVPATTVSLKKDQFNFSSTDNKKFIFHDNGNNSLSVHSTLGHELSFQFAVLSIDGALLNEFDSYIPPSSSLISLANLNLSSGYYIVQAKSNQKDFSYSIKLRIMR